ncbi:MAG: DAK2 domain-containing protein [Peptoniphilaceae bacterium]|uniref:DAK2 domain-containing protein n=1 Tax=Parvimonas sp. TaxID=1944660 RepID=UPI002A755F23|nr:DAK2 domain-containing protein [Parvimonas sp.]MDD7765282.1 DAK2 domain-containing protein [Peptoniphilaceae bacterium]MDY3050894.1 DAK2 domain-containing protein [Parvimonas sp.]
MINSEQLQRAFIRARNYLDSNREIVNGLNVFPVPDGDTGTNMTLTIKSSIKNLENSDVKNCSDVVKAVSDGALMGARGNSGVILSQILRGFYVGAKDKEELDVETLKECFVNAYKVAYKSVIKPTEGTILTVIREMGEFAEKSYTDFNDEVEFCNAILKVGFESLNRTPEILPILKEAGVVDAGGRGLLYLFEGALGNEIVEINRNYDFNKPARTEHLAAQNDEDIEFGYCTEFMITSDSEEYTVLRDKLSEIGDSLIVVKGDNIIKVHVHTNHPGQAIEWALEFGPLHDLKIDNMRRQHNHLHHTDKEVEEAKNNKEIKIENKKYGFVSISTGNGIDEIFKSMGVDEIITGGQTMNPSTEDILNAVDKINADDIFIFPNNSNIILVSEQAAKISKKNLHIIKTKQIPEAFSALFNFDESLSVEENIEAMTDAILNIKVGQITYSLRDTEIDGVKILKDDFMGISGGKIKISKKDISEVFEDLVAELIDDETSIVSVYYGEDVTKEDAEKLVEKVSENYDDVEIELVYGGQPVYYYLISAE